MNIRCPENALICREHTDDTEGYNLGIFQLVKCHQFVAQVCGYLVAGAVMVNVILFDVKHIYIHSTMTVHLIGCR